MAQVELGDGIVRACALPAEAPAPAAQVEAPTAGKVDLSAFSSMLKTKWKTGSAASGSAKPTPAKAGPVAAGQVRSFKITALDAAKKDLAVELIP